MSETDLLTSPETAAVAVRQRFSHADAAGRWNSMYAGATDNLEEENYRQRRDVTVAEVMRLVKPGSRVLDLGCGTGPVLAELRKRSVSVVGLDYSDDMLDYARSRLRAMGLHDAGLSQGDCRATPYPDASFDVIVCLGVISYIENYQPVLAEIHRLLKPGGTVIISFRNGFNPMLSDPVCLLRRAARRLLAPAKAREPRPFEIGRLLDHRKVTRKIEAEGLRRVRSVGIGYGPFRFAGRPLFSERRSIRISRWLDRLFRPLPLVGRWMTDVSLWVYRKP